VFECQYMHIYIYTSTEDRISVDILSVYGVSDADGHMANMA
jgi:hypothetical protein